MQKTQIVKELLKTGFPLEVVTSSKLREKSWFVQNNPLYKDAELEKAREMDLLAVKEYSVDEEEVVEDKFLEAPNFESFLVIQCKKTQNKDWVFFDNTDYPYLSPELGYFKCENEIVLRDFREHHIKDYLFGEYQDKKSRWWDKRERNQFYETTKTFCEVPHKPNELCHIWDALTTVIKALNYFENKSSPEEKLLQAYYPVVVLDGLLWIASLSSEKNRKISVRKVNKLLVEFDYWQDNSSTSKRYFIEVITKDVFQRWLDIIEKDNERIFEYWKDFVEKGTYKDIKNGSLPNGLVGEFNK